MRDSLWFELESDMAGKNGSFIYNINIALWATRSDGRSLDMPFMEKFIVPQQAAGS